MSVLSSFSTLFGESVRKFSNNPGAGMTQVVVRNPILFLFGDSLTARGSNLGGEDGLGWVLRLSAM